MTPAEISTLTAFVTKLLGDIPCECSGIAEGSCEACVARIQWEDFAADIMEDGDCKSCGRPNVDHSLAFVCPEFMENARIEP